MRRIGLLGGMFNPVHNGHLRIAIECLEAFVFDELRMLPCAEPPHRAAPEVSSVIRLNMLQLALGGIDQLEVDSRELARTGPSYTIETLRSLKLDYPEASLYLIIGTDAFFSFDKWHDWEKILSIVNIVIVQRPDFQSHFSQKISALLEECVTNDRNAFLAQSTGRIFQLQVSQLEISSSKIRKLLQENKSVQYLLPEVVLGFIKKNRLYK